MKKIVAYKIFYLLSALLVVAFLVAFLIDAFCYSSYIGSAPFYLYPLVDAILFLLPSAILFGVGFILQKCYRNKKRKGL